MTDGTLARLLAAAALTSLLGTAVAADNDEMTSASPATERSAESDLPEPVAELVGALSGVQRVEVLEDDTFAVHRRMVVTGSRIPRRVTIRVDENGEVVDWGDRPGITRIYTRDDLMRSGHVQLAEGLSRIDPAIRPR
jgi:hypothetical protein